MKGFTLIELLLVITITAALIYLGAGYWGRSSARVELDSAAEIIVNNLELARAKSMSQEKGEAWGVDFVRENDRDFLQVYSTGGHKEAKVYLPRGIKFHDFSAAEKIEFDKLDGKRSDNSTINGIKIYSLKIDLIRTIYVNSEGAIARLSETAGITEPIGSEPRLIAAGAFTTAGGTSANRIAQWDGSGWSALGTGMNDAVGL